MSDEWAVKRAKWVAERTQAKNWQQHPEMIEGLIHTAIIEAHALGQNAGSQPRHMSAVESVTNGDAA